jgi:hypothetical protein
MICNASARHARKCKAALPLANGFIFAVDFARVLPWEWGMAQPYGRACGFERRAAVAFRVVRLEVVVVRTFYGGRDYERILRSATEA